MYCCVGGDDENDEDEDFLLRVWCGHRADTETRTCINDYLTCYSGYATVFDHRKKRQKNLTPSSEQDTANELVSAAKGISGTFCRPSY